MLKPRHGLRIEMIRRFIKEEDIGLFQEGLRAPHDAFPRLTDVNGVSPGGQSRASIAISDVNQGPGIPCIELLCTAP
jgi:hypothetical protein